MNLTLLSTKVVLHCLFAYLFGYVLTYFLNYLGKFTVNNLNKVKLK